MNISVFLLLAVFAPFIDGRQSKAGYQFVPIVKGWIKLHRIPAKWEEARLRCHLEGSVLAAPLTAQLHAALKAVSQPLRIAIFTGFSAAYPGADFVSITGVPLDTISVSWAPGEPDNREGREQCLAMFSDGTLADVSCDQPRPYICYRKNSPMPEPGPCGTDPEYTLDSRTGSCYKFHRLGQSWARASMACVAEGGYLAVINNETEAQVLRELAYKNPAVYILAKYKDYIGLGFRDWSEHSIWMTVQGQTLQEAGYQRWAGGAPDNATTGEYCGSMFRSAELNDIWCEEAIPFICEKQPGSPADKDDEDDDDIDIRLR